MKVLNYREFRVTDEMLASKSKRFANYIIDRILFYLFFIVIAFITVIIAELLGNESIIQVLYDLENMNPLLDTLITWVIFVIFYCILESLSQRTIGKLITQTKVVLENGEKPSFEIIIIRSLCRIIPFEPFSFLGDLPKGWHDTLSKTFVVDIKIFDEHRKAHENYHLIGKKES